MKKLFRRRKRGTFAQEIVSAVAQVVFGAAAFATVRGGISILQIQPPSEQVDLLAPFSPTVGAVCLLVCPIISVGALLLRIHLTPKG